MDERPVGMSGDQAGERLGPGSVELYECGGGRSWVRRGAEVRLLDADDALLLEAIQGFRTAGEHAERLQRLGFVEERPGDLAARLNDLRDAGLLITEESFVRSLPRGEGGPAAPGWAVWPTCNRPAWAARSVESWIAAHRDRTGPRLAVVDDSEHAETRSALLGIGAPQLWYAGRSEKEVFAGRLAAAGLPREVLSFALSPAPALGTPYGANRNASLLAAAGEAFVSSDDDTLFHLATLPQDVEGLAFSSRIDAAAIYFQSDRAALLRTLGPGVDLLAAHGACLGRDAADCVRAAGSAMVLEDLGRELGLRLAARPHRVLLTTAGIYGDVGLEGSSLLKLSGESWERAVASVDHYEIARSGREAVRAVVMPTLSECGHLMGQHYGLDNRELLPPFFPAGRSEDGIFALMLRALRPEGLTAHLPVAVLHDPPPKPAQAAGEPSPQPLFADLLSLLIATCSFGPAARDPAERMRALAAHLAGMASLENAELEKWVRAQWVTHWASEMALCEQRIVEGPRGAPWVRDCAARLEQVEAHIEGGAAVWPRDLGGGDAAAAWREAGDRIRRFAELLEWWPAIVAAARELKEAGRGLLQPLGRRP